MQFYTKCAVLIPIFAVITVVLSIVTKNKHLHLNKIVFSFACGEVQVVHRPMYNNVTRNVTFISRIH